MRVGWAIAGGIVLGIGLAWWLARDPAAEHARAQRAERAAAAQARDARRDLYRWHDAAGVLHVSDTPPRGAHAERVARAPKSGIEVHGDR
jgi:type II secretory pathway pseudopilin PulG